jgi:hypothetical protein
VTPQHRAEVPPPLAERIRVAKETLDQANGELRALVVQALRAGASVRECAAVADMSTNTIQRWKKEAGIVTPVRKRPIPSNWPPGLT